jgi:uncharacterized protein (DUF427 family)
MDVKANPSPGFQHNPSRRISVEPFAGAVTVTSSDFVIAQSKKALVLREEDYPPVFYIPFEDIHFDALTRTDTSTHCPYKGDASYWAAGAVKDVMWAYEHPYDEMVRIKDHGAFYPDRVKVEAG